MESLKEKKNACVNKYLKYDSSLGFVAANDAWDACQKEMEAELKQYQDPSDAKCMDVFNLRSRIQELEAKVENMRSALKELEDERHSTASKRSKIIKKEQK